MDREPCPFRIIDDAGGAFGFGLVGGAVWHFVGGIRNAPKGHRLEQALARMKTRTPILGGSFAVWGTLFSVCDCTFTYLRKKEDPWNAIMSGAATGGILAIRGGIKSAGKNALVGGLILAAIEGLNIAVSRVIIPMFEKSNAQNVVVDRLEPPNDPLRSYSKRSGPLYNPTSTPVPMPSGYTTVDPNKQQGFDLDSISKFDTDNWSATNSEENNDHQEEKKKGWLW